jgi:hypothetical protein
MDRYFYKIVDDIDFVWKIERVRSDAYKLNETDFGHFVCNHRLFVPYLFKNIQDIRTRGLLNGYKEILPQVLTDDNCYLDNTIGLLHKNSYWETLFAVRHVGFLNKMSPIIFGSTIKDVDSTVYQKLMACDHAVGQKIYQAAYTYFKSLCDIDEYFSSTSLDTIDKFLTTLQLQAVYIGQNENSIRFAFRPSWDEEHGLSINLDVESFSVTIDD